MKELVVGRMYHVSVNIKHSEACCGFTGRYLGPFEEDGVIHYYEFDLGNGQIGYAGVTLGRDWDATDAEPRYVVTMACGHERVHPTLSWEMRHELAKARDYCKECGMQQVAHIRRIPGSPEE